MSNTEKRRKYDQERWRKRQESLYNLPLGERKKILAKRCARTKRWLASNPWYEKTESRKEYRKKWKSENRDSHNASSRKHREANQGLDRAKTAARKATKLQATPSWVNRKDLRDFYTRAVSYGLTVDHIVPLKHPLVCGLHVPWNLQLLSLSENSSKGNRFDIRV